MQSDIGQQSRCRIGVVSASHVKMAVQGGFAQLCHGGIMLGKTGDMEHTPIFPT